MGIRWSLPVIPRFYGVFDGRGQALSHLTISGMSHYLGLFGRLESGAVVRDLVLVDANVGRGRYVGALAGENAGTVRGCVSSGAVGEALILGGPVGRNFGDVTDCHNDATVANSGSAGGLLGENGGQIVRCANTGTVRPGTDVHRHVYVGGLVGCNFAIVTQCYNRGFVDAVVDSPWPMPGNTAGLVGYNSGVVTDCYSTGQVSASGSKVGGLAGCNSGRLTRCYSAGLINNPGQSLGGLVGFDRAPSRTGSGRQGEAVGCFWDTQASGKAASAGGTGKTTEQMQTVATFTDAGWDFVGETANGAEDIWWIDEGRDYPRLWWEAVELILDD